MTTHILIAHDLRETANLALQRANQLAAQHNAKLTVLHVLNPSHSQQQHTQAKKSLNMSIAEYAPDSTARVIMGGKPSEVVLQQIIDLDCDLLVLGAHHNRHDFFNGTSLDRIARRSTVPMLVVARDEFSPYKRALSALDFSVCSCCALEKAYCLLPPTAELHALHVYCPEKSSAKRDETEFRMQCMLIEQLLKDEQEKLPAEGPKLTHSVQQGGILRGLQEELKSRRGELLVLGSHGRSALSQALLGSLAQHFLHKAPCDIFVVR